MKAVYQIIFWTMFVYLYCHIVACVLWYNFRSDQIWLPAVDFGSFDLKVHLPRLDQDGELDGLNTFLYQFFTMYYNSAIAFALVEVNARTSG